MKTRTKIIAPASAAAIALAALMLLPSKPCGLGYFSYAGDRVGSQCIEVPAGRMFLAISRESTVDYPKCLPNFANVGLCELKIDDDRVVVGRCYSKPVLCPECETGDHLLKTHTPYYKYLADPSCGQARLENADK